MVTLRPATPVDAPVCAAILNAWIDATPWMPRVHPADDVVRHYRETVFPKRSVTVAEDEAILGYVAVDAEENEVTSLFVAEGARRRGVGRALLGAAKAERPGGLSLWTFQANEGARRFYAREGFVESRTTEGDNEERLADVELVWRP
ncbi:MAG: GNAT family N-acetyltransferase [Pseudomonadota bacterium]